MSQVLIGWFWVIFGSLCIGGGGLILATYGWNLIATDKELQNLIDRVVVEIDLNDEKIEAAKDLISHWPSRLEEETFSPVPFHDTYILALLTSDQLDKQKNRGRELYAALQNYHQSISRLNAGLRIVGRLTPGMFMNRELIPAANTDDWPPPDVELYSEKFLNLVIAHDGY